VWWIVEQQTRRERKKGETRRRILEAAFELFVSNGFENTTIDQITDKADVGKGTFYNYFPTKEAVLFDFMDNIGAQRGEKLWAVILTLQDTRQRLAKAFHSLASWAEEYPELIRVYLTDMQNKRLRESLDYEYNHMERYLHDIIIKGQEEGDIRDDMQPVQLVDFLMGIMVVQAFKWFRQGSGPGLYNLLIQGVDFFLIGALSTEQE
jgi:AcrR family transcriptional regulator